MSASSSRKVYYCMLDSWLVAAVSTAKKCCSLPTKCAMHNDVAEKCLWCDVLLLVETAVTWKL